MARVVLVVGLGFGDEGKGSIVDFLAQEEQAKLVVRFNGGAQAAHNVVTSDGRHHTFGQFGSGTFAGADTYLGPHMLVNPISMESEERRLALAGVTNAFDRMKIDEQALITNPFQIAFNRFKEASRGTRRHGSCGMGIAETVADALEAPEDALRAKDLRDRDALTRKLRASQQRKRAQLKDLQKTLNKNLDADMEGDFITSPGTLDYCIERFEQFCPKVSFVDSSYLKEALVSPGTVLFEGAQGVLLDQAWGTFPHVTRSDTTFNNALRLLEGRSAIRVGVFRTYFTRHGAGPLPTEDLNLRFHESNNIWSLWQKHFRWGHFDLNLARYALKVVQGVDHLAFTCLDHLEAPQVCVRYENFPVDWTTAPAVQPLVSPQSEAHLAHQSKLTESLRKVTPVYRQMTVSELAGALETPVGILSRGPKAEDKTWTSSF